MNGAQILGRTIRVDHVSNYKKKEEEDEETERKKREERGVCRAFQRGDCTRGAGCKFSHDEQVHSFEVLRKDTVIPLFGFIFVLNESIKEKEDL